jgi:hypothetical protein
MIVDRKQESVSSNLRINWHPEPNVIASALSINNVRIRLTQERWLHITEYHKELLDFQREVLLTIANPDAVYFSPIGIQPNFAAVKGFDQLADYGLARNLAVHYKEVEASTGFILTAFVISDKRLKKRFSVWRKLR